jgi:hypothetical protein
MMKMCMMRTLYINFVYVTTEIACICTLFTSRIHKSRSFKFTFFRSVPSRRKYEQVEGVHVR